MRGRAACLAVAALATLTAGCTRAENPRPELRPVPLPDLSGASEPVRSQLRERHSELARVGDDAATAPEAQATLYGELGKLFLAARLLEAAEPALMNAHTLAPAEARWPYYLGHLRRMAGDTEHAAAFFQRTLELQPDNGAARIWLGRMHLESGRPAAAAAEFARGQDVPDARFAALVGLGRAALLQGDHASAVRHFETALSAYPEGSIARYPLAMSYRALGDTARADAHLRLRGSGEVEPSDPWMDALTTILHSPMGHQRRGVEALNRGAFEEAATEFRKGLELQPETLLRVSLMHKLATTRFLMKDITGAVEQLEAGIRLDHTFAPNHYTLGFILASRGDVSGAALKFADAVERDPEYVEARIALGEALRKTGRSSAALPHLQRATILAPRSADARYWYAMALAESRRFREARDQLTAGRNANPGDGRFAAALTALEDREN
jgi:tetratricopeptide (TPR) repeat protein